MNPLGAAFLFILFGPAAATATATASREPDPTLAPTAAVSQATVPFDLYQGYCASGLLGCRGSYETHAACFQACSERWGTRLYATDWTKENGYCCCRDSCDFWVNTCYSGTETAVVPGKTVPEHAVCDPCIVCPNGATAGEDFVLPSNLPSLWLGVTCGDLMNRAKNVGKEHRACAEWKSWEFHCCPESPCPFCSGGITADESFLVPFGEGLDCSDAKEQAAITPESSEDCSQRILPAEFYCCPDQVSPCPFCPGGITADESFLVPFGGGLDCFDVKEKAAITRESSEDCSLRILPDEFYCCQDQQVAVSQATVPFDLYQGRCGSGFLGCIGDYETHAACFQACSEKWGTWLHATDWYKETGGCCCRDSCNDWVDTCDPGVATAVVPGKSVPEHAVCAPCVVCPNGATAGEDFVLPSVLPSLWWGVTCGDLMNNAKNVGKDYYTCAEWKSWEFHCCPDQTNESPCPFCSGGVTADESFLLPFGEGLDCSDVKEQAAITPESSEDCSQRILPEEFYCCQDQQAASPCPFCSGGITADESFLVPSWGGLSCSDVKEQAAITRESSEDCSQRILPAEFYCCPDQVSTCPFCSGGITADESVLLPSGEGLDCFDVKKEAAITRESSEDCSRRILPTEFYCCQDQQAESPCPFCSGGVTADESSVVLFWGGFNCFELKEEAVVTRESSEICSQDMMPAEFYCCPTFTSAVGDPCGRGPVSESVPWTDLPAAPPCKPPQDGSPLLFCDLQSGPNAGRCAACRDGHVPAADATNLGRDWAVIDFLENCYEAFGGYDCPEPPCDCPYPCYEGTFCSYDRRGCQDCRENDVMQPTDCDSLDDYPEEGVEACKGSCRTYTTDDRCGGDDPCLPSEDGSRFFCDFQFGPDAGGYCVACGAVNPARMVDDSPPFNDLGMRDHEENCRGGYDCPEPCGEKHFCSFEEMGCLRCEEWALPAGGFSFFSDILHCSVYGFSEAAVAACKKSCENPYDDGDDWNHLSETSCNTNGDCDSRYFCNMSSNICQECPVHCGIGLLDDASLENCATSCNTECNDVAEGFLSVGSLVEIGENNSTPREGATYSNYIFSGPLVDCQSGREGECPDDPPENSVCLIQPLGNNVYIGDCKKKGGVAAIFYNTKYPSWYDDGTVYAPEPRRDQNNTLQEIEFPFIVVSFQDGQNLLENGLDLEAEVTIRVIEQCDTGCSDRLPCPSSSENWYCDYRQGEHGSCQECSSDEDEQKDKCFFSGLPLKAAQECAATCKSRLVSSSCKFCGKGISGSSLQSASEGEPVCNFCPDGLKRSHWDRVIPFIGSKATCYKMQQFFSSYQIAESNQNCELALTFNYICGCEGPGYAGANSDAKKKALVWLPRMAAITSFLSSSIIIVDILRDGTKRKKIHGQLMVIMSAFDLVGSASYSLTSLPIPKEDYIHGAGGSDTTCSAQGFFIQMGTVAALVNVSLAIYYYCYIKLGWTESRIKKIRHWLFLCPITVGLTFAFVGLRFYDMLFLWCNNGADWWPESAVILAIFLATCTMASVCWDVYKTEQQTRRYAGGGTRNSMSSAVFWQSIWYLFSFYATWLPYLALQYLWSSGSGYSSSYGFVIVAGTLVPLQGFWNSVVYFRRRAKKKVAAIFLAISSTVSAALASWFKVITPTTATIMGESGAAAPETARNDNNGEEMGEVNRGEGGNEAVTAVRSEHFCTAVSSAVSEEFVSCFEANTPTTTTTAAESGLVVPETSRNDNDDEEPSQVTTGERGNVAITVAGSERFYTAVSSIVSEEPVSCFEANISTTTTAAAESRPVVLERSRNDNDDEESGQVTTGKGGDEAVTAAGAERFYTAVSCAASEESVS